MTNSFRRLAHAAPQSPGRRLTLMAMAMAGWPLHATGVESRPTGLAFPRDFGAHMNFGIEWWYVTGFATSQQREFGFQVTFFRSKVPGTQALKSRLAARHLVFAHAALTDVQGRKLWHDQRIARTGSGAAPSAGPSADMSANPNATHRPAISTPEALGTGAASEQDTAVSIGNWELRRTSSPALPPDARAVPAHALHTPRAPHTFASAYQAQVRSHSFSLDLTLNTTQPMQLHGPGGLSQKGPGAAHVSQYYSQPQLAVNGSLRLQGQRFDIAANLVSEASPASHTIDRPGNRAWLDHEWSDTMLPPGAAGWDWLGMNLFDGSTLMAFQMRDAAGQPLWDGGSFRAPGHAPYLFTRGEVRFQPKRHWKSPASAATYPVEWLVRTPADFYTVKPLLDAQELDSRRSTGILYWEGLSDLFDSHGRHVGRGYLEMTGYARPLSL